MELRVYNGEKFVRTTRWYLIAGIFFFGVVALALVGGNVLRGIDSSTFTRQSVFGTVLLLWLGWAYRTWDHRVAEQQVIVSLGELGVTIGEKTIPWNSVVGFGLEIDKRTQALHNIIFITKREKEIHTFADEQETIQEFIQQLVNHIPFVEHVRYTRVEKLIRRLKL